MLAKLTTNLTACALGAALAAGPALAQDVPDNSGLPSLSAIEPLAAEAQGLVHNVRVNVEQGFAYATNLNQPTELDQKSLQTSLGISADFGEHVFAGITGTYSREDITSTNLFAMPMAGIAHVLGVDAVVGVRPVEFLQLGVLGGIGNGSASYEFTGLGFPVPATPGDSSTRRLGAFLQGFYGFDRLMLTGTAAVVNTQTFVDYGPTNIPQTDTYGATILLAKVGAAYELTDQLTIAGGVTLNQVISQDIAAAQTGLDSNWLTLEAGLEYEVTSQWSLRLKAAKWLFNDRMDYTRVAVGATYKF